MLKYKINSDVTIPQDKRADINAKIIYMITNNLVEKTGFTAADIFNSYTGDGGLHELELKNFRNFHEYTEAKKEIEQGQFFTPRATRKLCA